MYTNLDCISNKMEEIENFIKINNVDIALLYETLPKNTSEPLSNDLTISIQGYDYFTDNSVVCILYIKNIDLEIKKKKN